MHRAGTLRNGRSRGANRLVIAVLILDVRTVSVRDFVVAIRRTLDLGGGGITVTRPSITIIRPLRHASSTVSTVTRPSFTIIQPLQRPSSDDVVGKAGKALRVIEEAY